MLTTKDLLGIKELSPEEINLILDTAAGFKDVLGRDIKKVPTLRGRTAVNLFFEPSTRTRTSFELAAKRLSTDVINFSVPTSSVVKGESLIDTALTVQALGADFIIIRHSSAGVPQALLDAFTIKEKKGKISGLTIAIVGDIAHSRVAKSNIFCLTKLGAKVQLIGPPTLIPREIEAMRVGVFHSMEEGLKDVDVLMMLRIQMERQGKGFFPSIEEYAKNWGLTAERLAHAKRTVVVMHPGPMNRGIEITSEIADGPNSVILEQVTNGIAVRMAVMYLLAGVKRS
jgi:aspartate carbamoyltransferase catalytic subunit